MSKIQEMQMQTAPMLEPRPFSQYRRDMMKTLEEVVVVQMLCMAMTGRGCTDGHGGDICGA